MSDEVVKSADEIAAEEKAAADAAEKARLEKLGFGFPHPEHVEQAADGSVVYKENPAPKVYE